jgi:hypothetical protein
MTDKTIIGVFCYKRAGKLKASVEALLRNPEAASMDIIFFCDGHKGEHDRQGVEETRAYINSLTGFRNIYKHFRERNLSTGPNFKAGLTHLFTNYDQFIVVEDDLVVSPNYISYMLQALEYYRNNPSVFCVTGYCFPLKKKSYPFDTTMHNRFCSYGWASWSDRVSKVIWDANELYRLTQHSPGFKRRLNSEGWDLYRMLLKQLNGKISTWDIQMQVHVSENAMKVAYPVVSKATNIGFDNESTNTFGIDYLKTPLDDGSKRQFNFCPADAVDPSLKKQLKKPYGLKALATRKMINTVIKLTSR